MPDATDPRDPLTEAMVRLADGDRSAFDEVHGLCWPRVQALTRRLLGSGPDADDAAQHAIIKVFERASAYDPAVGRALPWVLGIAAWESRTRRNRAARRREDPLHTAEVPCTGGPEDPLIDADLRAALEEVLGTLRPVDRDTLLAAMGRQERAVGGATFRKRLQRAMERLRAAWSQQHG